VRPRRHEANDVLCVAVPNTDLAIEDLMKLLEGAAWEYVRKQFSKRARLTLTEQRIDWLITNDPDKVDEFQPVHDCETCRSGNAKARAFLLESPDTTVAMANIHYVEVWPEYDLPPDMDDKDREHITELLDADDRISIPQAIEIIAFAKKKGEELRRLSLGPQEQKAAQWKSI
jgi:hypothetical protein